MKEERPEEEKKSMIRYVKVFKPNKEAVEEYDELFKKVYVNIYPSLKKSYKNLTIIQDRNNKK